MARRAVSRDEAAGAVAAIKALPVDELGIFFDVEEVYGDTVGPAQIWEFWDGGAWRRLASASLSDTPLSDCLASGCVESCSSWHCFYRHGSCCS